MGSDQSSDQTPKGTPEAGRDGSGGRAPRAGRRKSALTAAAVAAAVLVAGGGAAYLASGPDGGDGGAKAAPANRPEPLELDGYVAPGGEREIAPGEPDPNGPGTVYTTAAPLPKGPDRARLYKAGGPVSGKDVGRLAEALGLSGPPELDKASGQWRVGGSKKGGPALQVNSRAPGNWTYTRTGWYVSCPMPATKGGGRDQDTTVSSDCVPQTPAGPGGRARDGDPLSAKAAEREAAPVFRAAGLGDVKPDASLTVGSLRTVRADPDAGGLPTLGWTTTLDIGPKGVVAGHGNLSELTEGDAYPVVSAARALTSLQKRPGPMARDDVPRRGPGDIAPCLPKLPRGPKASAGPVLPADPGRTKPDTGGNGSGGRPHKPRIAPCLPHRPLPQEVRKAEFGLSSQRVGRSVALVPSWLFTVAAPGSDDTRVMAETAVDPEYIVKPVPAPRERDRSDKPAPDASRVPGSPGATGADIESYTVEGRTLTVRFWGGVCQDYRATARESGGRVKVEVTGWEKKPGQVCILIAEEFTEKVKLDKPLGDRKVVDAATGDTVPKRKK